MRFALSALALGVPAVAGAPVQADTAEVVAKVILPGYDNFTKASAALESGSTNTPPSAP